MTRHLPGHTRTETPAEGGLSFDPIPPAELQQIRAAGVDEAGNRLSVHTDTTGGSAYAERGPVFIHAEPCSGLRIGRSAGWELAPERPPAPDAG
jgi:hypothetical protein